jgi:hypothetical protein
VQGSLHDSADFGARDWEVERVRFLATHEAAAKTQNQPRRGPLRAARRGTRGSRLRLSRLRLARPTLAKTQTLNSMMPCRVAYAEVRTYVNNKINIPIETHTRTACLDLTTWLLQTPFKRPRYAKFEAVGDAEAPGSCPSAASIVACRKRLESSSRRRSPAASARHAPPTTKYVA